MREVPRSRTPIVEELEERVRGQLVLYFLDMAGGLNEDALDTLEKGDTTITVDLTEPIAEERRRRKEGRMETLEQEMERLKKEIGMLRSDASTDQQRRDHSNTLELRRDR